MWKGSFSHSHFYSFLVRVKKRTVAFLCYGSCYCLYNYCSYVLIRAVSTVADTYLVFASFFLCIASVSKEKINKGEVGVQRTSYSFWELALHSYDKELCLSEVLSSGRIQSPLQAQMGSVCHVGLKTSVLSLELDFEPPLVAFRSLSCCRILNIGLGAPTVPSDLLVINTSQVPRVIIWNFWKPDTAVRYHLEARVPNAATCECLEALLNNNV